MNMACADESSSLAPTTAVFLYGPPAAGKLTVAEALAARTGYKVFHNHATFDVVAEFLEPFSKPFGELVRRLRVEILDACIRERISLILTMVYDHRKDGTTVVEFEEVVRSSGGRFCRVQLKPPPHVLERRLTDESRAKHRKLRDVERLRESLEQWDMYTPIAEGDLSIDNSELTASEVADLIQHHYHL